MFPIVPQTTRDPPTVALPRYILAPPTHPLLCNCKIRLCYGTLAYEMVNDVHVICKMKIKTVQILDPNSGPLPATQHAKNRANECIVYFLRQCIHWG